jgi:hypothetical protein
VSELGIHDGGGFRTPTPRVPLSRPWRNSTITNQPSNHDNEVARLLFARFDALLAGAAPTPLERELLEDLLTELYSPVPGPDQQPLRHTTHETRRHGAPVRRRRRPFA